MESPSHCCLVLFQVHVLGGGAVGPGMGGFQARLEQGRLQQGGQAQQDAESGCSRGFGRVTWWLGPQSHYPHTTSRVLGRQGPTWVSSPFHPTSTSGPWAPALALLQARQVLVMTWQVELSLPLSPQGAKSSGGHQDRSQQELRAHFPGSWMGFLPGFVWRRGRGEQDRAPTCDTQVAPAQAGCFHVGQWAVETMRGKRPQAATCETRVKTCCHRENMFTHTRAAFFRLT